MAVTEHLEQFDEKFIDLHSHPGNMTAGAIQFHSVTDREHAPAHGGWSPPDGPFIVAQNVRQLTQVRAGEYQPVGPSPVLIGTSDAHIQNEEVKAATIYVRKAD